MHAVHAAARGIGICEMPAYAVRKDVEQMNRIFNWLNDWRTRRLGVESYGDLERAFSAEVLTPVELTKR